MPIPRTFPSVLSLLAGVCIVVSLPTSAQTPPDPMQEIAKCVRGGEVFYTNDGCPKGARPLKLNDPMGEPKQLTPRSERVERVPSRSKTEPSLSSESSGSFRPLSSFPRLPDSGGADHTADAPRSSSAPEMREAPMRAGNRPVESAPVPDAAAANQTMCSFVAAELSRLSVEAASADEPNKARIAIHQKRLNERATQLQCPS